MTTKPVSYQDIFDDISFQDADDSRSVLSPAAYLADLLFLKDDIGQDDAVDVRRPDIKTDILLNRENTYKTVPYLSIANKVMANYLAQGEGDVAKQLQFSPYPFNAPYSLPFNEATAVTRKSVETRDTSMHELYMKFAADPNPTIAARELLGLSQEEFSFIAYDCGPGSGKYSRGADSDYATYVKKMWGLQPEDTFANLSKLDTFLETAMMSEKELKSILFQNCSKNEINGIEVKEDGSKEEITPIQAKNDFGCFFINNGVGSGDNVLIDESNSISTIDEEGTTSIFIQETGRTSDMKQYGDFMTIKEIPVGDNSGHTLTVVCIALKVIDSYHYSALTPDYYDRFHRFVRLAKALGWSYQDLDTVLMAVCDGRLNENTIAYVAAINEWHKATKTPIDELCVLFNTIKNYGEGDGEEPEHLFHRLFNEGEDEDKMIKDLTGDELDLRLMSSLKLSREMLDYAKEKTASLKGGDLKADLAKLFRYVTLANILKLNVKEVEVLLSVIQDSMECFVDKHTFEIDLPFDKPASANLLEAFIAASIADRESSLWIIQKAMKVVSWMKECNISMKQLHFMVSGNSVGETIPGVLSQDQIKVVISQWNEMMQKLLLTELSFVTELVSNTQSKDLRAQLITDSVLAENGLVLGSIDRVRAAELLNQIGVTGTTDDEAFEKECNILMDTLTNSAAAQEEAFYLSLQNQFGLSHKIINTVAMHVCKNPSESGKELINNLISPVIRFVALKDGAAKDAALAEINDFYTILQQYLMLVGKIGLNEREVEAFFKAVNLRDVTIGEESKLPSLASTDVTDLLDSVKSPLIGEEVDAVFKVPGTEKIVVVSNGGYAIYNNDLSPAGAPQYNYSQFNADIGVPLPTGFATPIKAAANPAANQLILFDTNGSSWLWTGSAWEQKDYATIDNPLAISGHVDAAYTDATGLYLFCGEYLYKYDGPNADSIAEGYPQKIAESELFGELFDETVTVNKVSAAYKVEDRIHLHVPVLNEEELLFVGESGLRGSYSLVKKTTAREAVAKVQSFLGDGGHVVTAFIGTVADDHSNAENPTADDAQAMYVFVKKENQIQYYRYSDPAKAFQSGSNCDEGYPKLVNGTNSSHFSQLYADSKAPFELTSAVTVPDYTGKDKTFLFAGSEYACTDDLSDRNPISSLWIDNSPTSSILNMQAGFVSEHGWTYMIADNGTYRYNSADYSSVYDEEVLDTSYFWGLPEGVVVDAAFMIPVSPTVSYANQRACLLYTENTVKKYAFYDVGPDGAVNRITENIQGELMEYFQSEGGGYPDLAGLDIRAVYCEEVYDYMTLHIFHVENVMGKDTMKEKIYAMTPEGAVITDQDVDPKLGAVMDTINITTVFKGLDTTYYFSSSEYTYTSRDEDGVPSYATKGRISSFWGRIGIPRAIREFPSVKMAFNHGSHIYLIGENEYLKATYDTSGIYDGFVVDTAYPKSNTLFNNEGTGIDITGKGEIANYVSGGYATFTDTTVDQWFALTTNQSGPITNMSRERNLLQTAHTFELDWAFAYQGKTYLFANNVYYRYTGNLKGMGEDKTLYVDEGYPKAFTVENFEKVEGFGFIPDSTKNLTSENFKMTLNFDNNDGVKSAYGKLLNNHTPQDVKSVIYDDETLFIFTDKSVLSTKDLNKVHGEASKLQNLSAAWRTTDLLNAPQLFNAGCDWAVTIDGLTNYGKDYLHYREGMNSFIALPAGESVDCGILDFFSVEHSEKYLFYKEVVVRRIDTVGGVTLFVVPITDLYNGLPPIANVTEMYKVNNTIYLVSGDEYVRVNEDKTFTPISEMWRLRDDFEGMTLVDIDLCKKFKALSGQFDITDNSILNFFNGTSRSNVELNMVTGWAEGNSGTEIASKIYSAPGENKIPKVSKLADVYNYATRFNVSPRQLWDKVWSKSLFSADDSTFGSYYVSGTYVLEKPIVYGDALPTIDNRQSASISATDMVRSVVERKERDEYVADFDRALNSRKRDALVGLSLVKRTGEFKEELPDLELKKLSLINAIAHTSDPIIRANMKKELHAVVNRIEKISHVASSRDLYAHLLTDIMMSEETEISKIKEAILAMQLYYHRYLMNLEEGPDFIDRYGDENPHEGLFDGSLKQWWEWMQNYRVWEANRKVFMYPENYIRPELRHDKSPEFKELESSLLENEITDENVTIAYKKYLDGFNTVSQLNITGGYVYGDDNDSVSLDSDSNLSAELRKAVMFGVTKTEPYEHYYTTGDLYPNNKDGEASYDIDWAAWEKIDVQIKSKGVKPVYAFGRMFVFWIEYQKGIVKVTDQDTREIYEPVLYFAYYNLNKEWSTPQYIGNIFKQSLNNFTNTECADIFKDDNFLIFPKYWENESGKEYIVVTVSPENSYNNTINNLSWKVNDTLEVSSYSYLYEPNDSSLLSLKLSSTNLLLNNESFSEWDVYPKDKNSQNWFSFNEKGGAGLCIPLTSQKQVVPGILTNIHENVTCSWIMENTIGDKTLNTIETDPSTGDVKSYKYDLNSEPLVKEKSSIFWNLTPDVNRYLNLNPQYDDVYSLDDNVIGAFSISIEKDSNLIYLLSKNGKCIKYKDTLNNEIPIDQENLGFPNWNRDSEESFQYIMSSDHNILESEIISLISKEHKLRYTEDWKSFKKQNFPNKIINAFTIQFDTGIRHYLITSDNYLCSVSSSTLMADFPSSLIRETFLEQERASVYSIFFDSLKRIVFTITPKSDVSLCKYFWFDTKKSIWGFGSDSDKSTDDTASIKIERKPYFDLPKHFPSHCDEYLGSKESAPEEILLGQGYYNNVEKQYYKAALLDKEDANSPIIWELYNFSIGGIPLPWKGVIRDPDKITLKESFLFSNGSGEYYIWFYNEETGVGRSLFCDGSGEYTGEVNTIGDFIQFSKMRSYTTGFTNSPYIVSGFCDASGIMHFWVRARHITQLCSVRMESEGIHWGTWKTIYTRGSLQKNPFSSGNKIFLMHPYAHDYVHWGGFHKKDKIDAALYFPKEKVLYLFGGFTYLQCTYNSSGRLERRTSGSIQKFFKGVSRVKSAFYHPILKKAVLLVDNPDLYGEETYYKAFTLTPNKLDIEDTKDIELPLAKLDDDWSRWFYEPDETFSSEIIATCVSSEMFYVIVKQIENEGDPSETIEYKWITYPIQDMPTISILGEYAITRVNSNSGSSLSKKLFISGFDDLLSLSTQNNTKEYPFYFHKGESPSNLNSDKIIEVSEENFPILPSNPDGLDFNSALKNYYWEIFFHIPFLIANQLNEQQKFEDAKKWFEYVFNPIGNTSNEVVVFEDGEPISRNVNYWNFIEFYKDQARWEENNESLYKTLKDQTNLLSTYYNDPFNPHAIAQLRPVAYRKAIVMAYIDSLIDWGDNLYRQYTHESINEARMLYLLALELLGGKPVSSGERELSEDDVFDNIYNRRPYHYHKDPNNPGEYIWKAYSGTVLRYVDFENTISEEFYTVPKKTMGESNVAIPNDTLCVGTYFYLPENRQFIQYWDRIEERINNIRSGRNIDGKKVPLPLFQPPIDPMLLVKAKANGISLSEVVKNLNVSIPHYRYNFMVAKAKELASRVSSLGNSLLSSLEKKDAEELAFLRTSHEKQLLEVSQEIREAQLEDRLSTKSVLTQNKLNAQFRLDHYNRLIEENLSNWEASQLISMAISQTLKTTSGFMHASTIPTTWVPTITLGPFGGVTVNDKLHEGSRSAANFVSAIGDVAGFASSMSSTIGGFERRREEWEFQRDLAEKEIDSIDEQLKGADIQIEIAKKEIRQAELQRKHNESVDLFMTSKFTNKELYQWMSSKLSGLFYQTYQMALDLAKQAQKSFQFELGLKETEVDYLTSYYWDSQKKGLLAGEVLMADLDRMDKGYMEKNSRRFEISKSVSLLDIAPEAVLDLKSKKKCNFTLSEKLFALDFPSHYGRQIKSISVTIPAVVGPYQNVNASLTQQSHYTLLEPHADSMKNLLGDKEAKPAEGAIRADWRGQQQIAVSRGVNDSGMFQLNFNDERYLPFEGTGAFSTWELALTGHSGSFDINTISDVIINVEYTALQGGETFGSEVEQKLEEFPVVEKKVFDVPQYFSAEWNAYKENPESGLTVALSQEMFPGIEAANSITIYNPETNELQVNEITTDIKSSDVMVQLGNLNTDALIFIVDYEMKYTFKA